MGFTIAQHEDKITSTEVEVQKLQATLAREQAEKLGLDAEIYNQMIRENEVRYVVSITPMKAIRCEIEEYVSDGQILGHQIAVNHEVVECEIIDFYGSERTKDIFEVAKIDNYQKAIPADVLMTCNKWNDIFDGEQSFEIYSPKWSSDPLVVMRFNGGRLSYIIAEWGEFYDL